MKLNNKTCVFTVILSLFFILLFNQVALCQPPPPPPGGAGGTGHNLTANQGGAPVGEGVWILFTFAIGYGIYSYVRRNAHNQDITKDDDVIVAINRREITIYGEKG